MTDHQWANLVGSAIWFAGLAVIGGLWLRRWMRT